MGVTVVRGLIGGVGLLLIIGGVAIAAAGADLFAALTFFVPGIVIIAGVLLERTRYRSLHAERTGDGHGPGGGEPAHPEPRFQPTDERFIDPTTHVALQVWVDPSTGERRYVPLA